MELSTKSSVERHVDTVHKKDRNQAKEEPSKITQERRNQDDYSNVMKIVPDQDFLTQNTADLKTMLDAIPNESLEYEVDVFEKGFKEVLNSEKIEVLLDNQNT